MTEEKPTKYYSSIQENLIADFLGWSVVSASGCRIGYPGDIKSEAFLGECKTHVEPGKSILFANSVWKKLKDESMSGFRYPVLFVDDGSQTIEKTWCLFNTVPGMRKHINVYTISTEFHFEKNIVFKHDLIFNKFYKKDLSQYILCLRVRWHGEDVYITTLQNFKDLCERCGVLC